MLRASSPHAGMRTAIAASSAFAVRALRALRAWHLLPLFVVLAVIALSVVANQWSAASIEADVPTKLPKAGYGPGNYSAAIADADQRIELGREKMRRAPSEWTSQETLARGLMARAALTGDYREWAEARQLLDTGMASAPPGSGPVVADATLALSTHRLDAAEHDLEILKHAAVPPDLGQRSGMAGLAGDIALYRGDMKIATGHYLRGAQMSAGPAINFRIAVLAMTQARFGDADAAIFRSVAGDRQHTPQMLAQAAMRLGAHALAQGNWRKADQWFAQADQIFSGYWLIAAHRVQAAALRGDPTAADQMAAVARRSNSAEAMDAAAMLYRQRGDGANSRRWANRAGALWEARMQILPEAAIGHALEHELAFGTAEKALDLARKNVVQRPYGEARLLFASALIMNNRPQDALAEIARAESSGWRSAPLYAVKAEAAALAGQAHVAQAARASAEKINPGIFDPRTSLIWFSHG